MDTTFHFIAYYVVFFIAFYALCNFSKKSNSSEQVGLTPGSQTDVKNEEDTEKKKLKIIPLLLSLIFTIFARFGLLMPKNLHTDEPFKIENLWFLTLYFVLLFVLFYGIFNFSIILKEINKYKLRKRG